tara:strand:- start:1325 stop:1549 length:225 start_codon:yes stop_codon:yes gene_type:complete
MKIRKNKDSVRLILASQVDVLTQCQNLLSERWEELKEQQGEYWADEWAIRWGEEAPRQLKNNLEELAERLAETP